MERYVNYEQLKELHVIVRGLNKIYWRPEEEIFGVCNQVIKKLTDYFFMILYLGNASFGNGHFFTQLKKSPLIKHFGPIYIYFDEYPRYTGRTSNIFETNINDSIQCDHGYDYSSRKQKMCTCVLEKGCEITKNCFLSAKQIEKCPKTTLCKDCTYVQKYRNKIDENIDSPPDNEPTFSA